MVMKKTTRVVKKKSQTQARVQRLLQQEHKINKKTLHDKTLHTIVGVVFAFVAILHLVRFSFGLPLTIGYYDVSLWISFAAALGLGYLALWVWRGA
jgi:Na+/proline symporter